MQPRVLYSLTNTLTQNQCAGASHPLGRSFVNDLEQAVGQYVVYRDVLVETALDFKLYLAITQGTYKSNFQSKLAQMIINRNPVKLLIVDPESEVIVQWID